MLFFWVKPQLSLGAVKNETHSGPAKKIVGLSLSADLASQPRPPMSRRVYLASILHYELKIQIFVQILRGIVAFKSSKNQIQTYNTIIPILFFFFSTQNLL